MWVNRGMAVVTAVATFGMTVAGKAAMADAPRFTAVQPDQFSAPGGP